MMFLPSYINAKVNLVAGMAFGFGMAILWRQMCKKRRLDTRNTATKNETID